jgi:hypothetical protein
MYALIFSVLYFLLCKNGKRGKLNGQVILVWVFKISIALSRRAVLVTAVKEIYIAEFGLLI